MKCSKCGNEMEKGVLSNHGVVWSKKNLGLFSFIKWVTGGLIVSAFRCSSCQNVELKTEIK